MAWPDLLAMLRGYEAEQMAEMNRFRHLAISPLLAMGSKITPQKFLPLPIDHDDMKVISKEDFTALARKLAEMDKKKMAKA